MNHFRNLRKYKFLMHFKLLKYTFKGCAYQHYNIKYEIKKVLEEGDDKDF